MPKKNRQTDNQNPGMVLAMTFAVMFVVSSLVILLANSFFPQNVVLGTANISTNWAILHSMGTLAIILTFSLPFLREWEIRKDQMLTDTQWMLAYFVINFAGLWVVARYADELGLGISSWMTVAALALVLDLTQGAAMMRLEKWRTK